MQMREAENAPAADARAALEQIDAPSALVAVGREIGVAKEAEFSHRWMMVTSKRRRIACAEAACMPSHERWRMIRSMNSEH
jgi:hypothetical protein